MSPNVVKYDKNVAKYGTENVATKVPRFLKVPVAKSTAASAST